MKYKKITILIVLVLLTNGFYIFAQDSTFTIQSFKPQNIKDAQILIEIDTYNYGDSDNEKPINTQTENVDDTDFSLSYNFRMNSLFKYVSPKSFFYVNPSIYLDQQIRDYKDEYSSVKLYPDLDYSPYNSRFSETNSGLYSCSISSSGGYYFWERLGITGELNAGYSTRISNSEYENKYEIVDSLQNEYQKTSEISFNEDESRDTDFEMYFAVGPIYGRILEGKYSAKAIEIIYELSNSGNLINEPTSSQMKQLAAIIYEEKNHYYYDSRIKRIESINRINNYLISDNIINESSSAFSVVNDIYNYSYTKISKNHFGFSRSFYRPFGFQIGLYAVVDYEEKLSIDYRLSDKTFYYSYFNSYFEFESSDTLLSNERDTSKTEQNYGTIGAKLSASYAIPFGWHWHLITDATIQYLIADNPIDNYFKSDTKNLVASKGISAEIQAQLQYYLNSRTNFYLTQSILFDNLEDNSFYTDSEENEVYIVYEYKELESSTSFGTTHYLTPRLRLNLFANFEISNLWNGVCYSDDSDFEIPSSYFSKLDRTDWFLRFYVDYYLW